MHRLAQEVPPEPSSLPGASFHPSEHYAAHPAQLLLQLDPHPVLPGLEEVASSWR
jgi:hypothetical protein